MTIVRHIAVWTFPEEELKVERWVATSFEAIDRFTDCKYIRLGYADKRLAARLEYHTSCLEFCRWTQCYPMRVCPRYRDTVDGLGGELDCQ
jgi:hypothetical protein